MRVLIADDETAMTRALEALLKKEHYSVDVVDNGQDALDYALTQEYDGLVLDIMMPKLSGLEVLTTLRERGITTPIMLLTAKSEIEDRVTGLSSGADDYLPKPFDPREFVARVGALTRRRTSAYMPDELELGNVKLDRSTFELSGPEGTVRLSSKEYQMLELMMRQKGRPISTEQFMERIWGYDSEAELNVVWVYISYLRKKLESVGADVAIAVRRGYGYLLEIKQ